METQHRTLLPLSLLLGSRTLHGQSPSSTSPWHPGTELRAEQRGKKEPGNRVLRMGTTSGTGYLQQGDGMDS